MERTMRKNKAMRAASVFFVLTLVSTCGFSGVLAKYVSTDSGNDTARVAKFGVVASVSGTLFGDAYAASSDNGISVWADTTPGSGGYNGTDTVIADTVGTKVMAPGTMNDKGMTFSVKGKPEVSTTVSFGKKADDMYAAEPELAAGTYGVMVPFNGKVTSETVQGYHKLNDGNTAFVAAVASDLDGTPPQLYELREEVTLDDAYKPIKWSTKAGSNDASVATDLKAAFDAVTAGLGNASSSYAPNVPIDKKVTLTWSWPFTGDGNDAKDTVLGDLIAASNSGAVNTDSYVVKLNGSAYDIVKVGDVAVVNGADDSNKVYVAYTGNVPAAAYTGDILLTADNDAEPPITTGAMDKNNGVCAVLGAAVDASITAEQAD